MLQILDVLMYRERRHAFIRVALRPRSSRRRGDADQVEIRGGWSGGAPIRPSAIKSTRENDGLWVWKVTCMAFVGTGSAGAIVIMHVATSGQSGQPLFFCPSGQQGMSPDIADISLVSATGSRFAAAGVTSGATTNPTITKTASRRPMSRRRFMSYHHTGWGTWEGCSLHMFAK
jgi:hypothetical protein